MAVRPWNGQPGVCELLRRLSSLQARGGRKSWWQLSSAGSDDGVDEGTKNKRAAIHMWLIKMFYSKYSEWENATNIEHSRPVSGGFAE